MRKHKFIQLLSKLPPKDIRGFKKFLIGMYSKEHRFYRLFNYLDKYYPHFDHDNLNADQISTKVFDTRSYNRKILNTEFSKLGAELKKYLVCNYQDDFPFEKNFMIFQLYKKFELEKQAKEQLAVVERTIEKEKLKDVWYWLKKMRIAHEEYFDPEKDQVNIGSDALEQAMSNLDIFYGSLKIKYSIELYNRNIAIKDSLPEIFCLDQVTQKNWEQIVIRCNKLLLLLLKTRDDIYYYQLENLLYSESELILMRISTYFLHTLLIIMLNGVRKT